MDLSGAFDTLNPAQANRFLVASIKGLGWGAFNRLLVLALPLSTFWFQGGCRSPWSVA